MNFNHSLILASNSPRRHEILKGAGYSFKVQSTNIEETFPEDMPTDEVAQYLAVKKANALKVEGEEIVIAADTVVVLENDILGKPKHAGIAEIMLHKLSGKRHDVITGVAISDRKKMIQFSDTTAVFFKSLTEEQIDYYIKNYAPFDKAGSYGIQEWIGMVGIERIEGSYFNVMGLPIHRVNEELMKF